MNNPSPSSPLAQVYISPDKTLDVARTENFNNQPISIHSETEFVCLMPSVRCHKSFPILLQVHKLSSEKKNTKKLGTRHFLDFVIFLISEWKILNMDFKVVFFIV